jgi:hypothetical protein
MRPIANEVRKRLNKKDKYDVGENLICRFYKKDEGNKLNVNISCDVVKIDRGVTIQDIKSKEERSFYENIIDKHFTYAYCATCHSRQETTIRDS